MLILTPAFVRAQSPGDTSDKAGRNLTQQAQNEVAIALPGFAPLAERVLPSVVNISVELAEHAASQDERATGYRTRDGRHPAEVGSRSGQCPVVAQSPWNQRIRSLSIENNGMSGSSR